MSVAYEALLALTNQIAKDGDAIATAGIELHHWGPDQENDTVAMFVRSEAEPAQKYMDAVYGEGLVAVCRTSAELPLRC